MQIVYKLFLYKIPKKDTKGRTNKNCISHLTTENISKIQYCFILNTTFPNILIYL